MNFHISLAGLESIGISEFQVEKVSEVIEELILEIAKNPIAELELKKIVSEEGFLIGHSILIMMIAGAICKETQLPFESTMKKICMAAFFHDFSILNFSDPELEMKIYEIEDEKLLAKLLDHPIQSAKLVPNVKDLLEDVKRIISEHHEMPGGDGYPRKLNSNQISSLSALFIISHHITLCLIRNDYNKDRLRNFIKNNEILFKHGNFSKFYAIAMKKFS
jgi:HD-GYP domain-containing protein (c-di-GMP phosphodiesterase class II)